MAAGGDLSPSAEPGNTSFKIPWQEKLEKAQRYKAEGNFKYKEGNHKAAVSKYHRALLYLKGIDSSQGNIPLPNLEPQVQLPDEVIEETKALKATCYNNLSACLLQYEKPPYEKIKEYCDQVLLSNPDNVKAMFRKAVALYHNQDYEDALQLLETALSNPNGQEDPNIRKYINLCTKAIGEQDSRMRNTYMRMFGNVSLGE